MNTFKVLRHQSTAVNFVDAASYVFAIFIVSFLTTTAFADGTTPPINFNMPEDSGPCGKTLKDVVDASNKIAEFCQSGTDTPTAQQKKECLKSLLDCNDGEAKLADSITSGDDGNPDPENYKASCKKLALEGCADVGGTKKDLRDDANQANKDLSSLQKERDELNDKNSQAADKSQQGASDAAAEAQKTQLDLMKQEMQASQELQTKLAAMKTDEANRLMATQQEFDKYNQQIIGYRSQIRKETTDIAQTTLQWNVSCRNAAQTEAQKLQDSLDAQDTAMFGNGQMILNYQMGSAAYGNNQRLAVERKRILNKYNAVLTTCLKGESDPGTSLQLALNTAKNKLANDTKEANDQLARLNGLQKTQLSNLATLQGNDASQAAMLTQQTQQNIMMMQQQATLAQNQAMMKQMQSMASAAQGQQSNNAQLKRLDGQITDATNNYVNATTRLACGSDISKEEAQTKRADRKDSTVALKTLSSKCETYRSAQQQHPGQCPTVGICDDVVRAEEKKGPQPGPASEAVDAAAKGDLSAAVKSGQRILQQNSDGTTTCVANCGAPHPATAGKPIVH